MPGAHGRTGPVRSRCTRCGEPIEARMNFCPDCGAPVDRAPPDPLDSHDRAALERRVSRALEAGWEIERDSGTSVVLVKRSLGSLWGHALVALLTVWWTGGFGNLLYAVYSYVGEPRRSVVRPGEPLAEAPSRDGPGLGSAVAAAGLGLIAAVALAVALWLPSTAASLVPLSIAAAFGLAAVGLAPPVRRRLADRRPITANGRTRSVDERIVVRPAEPCSSCYARIDEGIERIYRTDVRLLGVPLATTEKGRNVYCRACANGEVGGTGSPEREREPDGRAAEPEYEYP